MSYLQQFLLPWLISNIAAVLILWISYKKPTWGRVLFFLLFGWACWMNLTTARSQPEVYLEYAPMAVEWYADFITGWFSRHITTVVSLIAIGQALIAAGMLLKGWVVKIASLGAILFLLSIAPLGIGAGFPFSLIVSLAAWFIHREPHPHFLWKALVLNPKSV